MKAHYSAFTLTLIFLVTACSLNDETTMEDLGQTMMDLRIYQENLGDRIKAGQLQDAAWLLDGTDSLLKVMSNTFTEHRKLKDPFAQHYKKRLKSPLNEINNAIRKDDTAAALKQYRILVRRCNSCHTDHDIDKEVKF
jgi:hypothetical protein